MNPEIKATQPEGLYVPEPEKLAKVRQEIDYNGEKLERIVNEKKFQKYYGELWKEDMLKNAPKGYPKDHPNVNWLKMKSFIVIHNLTDKEVVDRKFLKLVADAFKTLKPMNDFLSEAID